MIWPENLVYMILFTLVSRWTMEFSVADASVFLSLETGLDHHALMPTSTTRNSHHCCEPKCKDWAMFG